jgi:DNA-binding transcriptional ArsR family regulator
MNPQPEISKVAALIGEPARAAMLVALLDGRALTAGELANLSGISPQTASSHLGKLLEGNLLALEAQGRHRYYRLAGVEVARALEALGVLSEVAQNPNPFTPKVPLELRFARSCYDHLAGKLGVLIAEGLRERGYLSVEFVPTPMGCEWLKAMGIDASVSARRVFSKPCLDWSERKPPVGGVLGARLMARLLELGWVMRLPQGRSVRLTVEGRRGLERELGLKLGQLEVA